jgi:hypothetical protein
MPRLTVRSVVRLACINLQDIIHCRPEVVGLERGPISLLSTIEEPLRRNSSGFDIENREYGLGNPLR